MRKMILTIGGLLLLGCAGLTEELIEGVTGEEIEISEDGMSVTLPGGGRMEMKFGESAIHDPALSLSPPPSATPQMSAVISLPDQPTTHVITYHSDAEASGMIELYRSELSAKGLEVEERTTSEGGTVLTAQAEELNYFASVGPSEDGGSGSTVALGVGSSNAIEEGLSNSMQ